jgi:hypothetical protein
MYTVYEVLDIGADKSSIILDARQQCKLRGDISARVVWTVQQLFHRLSEKHFQDVGSWGQAFKPTSFIYDVYIHAARIVCV